MIRGEYQRFLGERSEESESFDFESHDGRARLRATLRLSADGDTAWAIDAAFDHSWRLSTLEVRKWENGLEAFARYGWDGDSWIGEVRRGAALSEVCVPMAGGLEPVCLRPSFEGTFLRRVGLAPLSQRRVETLEVRLEDLEVAQSHCIIERLADTKIERKGASVSAALYRWTDPAGRQEFLWVGADHLTLARAESLTATPYCVLRN